MSANSKAQTGKGSSRTLDLLLVILLLTVGLVVRWLYVQAVAFPPLDDPAFYLTTGKNLVTGQGLTVDVLWSYQIPFSSVTHPSHEHWMPVTTGLIAAAFALQRILAEGTALAFRTGQLPGLILGALLVPLTYLLARRSLPKGKKNRALAVGAALLIAVNATLGYQSASADSSAPYALLAAWALLLAVRQPGEQSGYLGAGLLIGLAYLTRSDGLLLLVAVPLAWWLLPAPARTLEDLPDNPASLLVWLRWPRAKNPDQARQLAAGPGLAHLLALGVAFALAVAAWLVRNYFAFGTPLPSSVLNQAWLIDYVDTFNYLWQPTMETWLAQGWQAIVAQRGQALLHNGRVFVLVTFPWGILALPGLWLLGHKRTFVPAIVYGLMLFMVTALVFPVSSMSGTFYHSLGAVTPFLAVAAVYAVYRGAQFLFKKPRLAQTTSAVVIAGLLALAGFQLFAALPAVGDRHEAEGAQFEAAAQWLAQNADPADVVMTTQAYTLNYASGHPCIVLPGNEPPDAAWQAAQHYGARFLVTTQAFGQYPQILHEQPDPRFHFLETVEGNEIFEIVLAPEESPNGSLQGPERATR